MKAIVISYFLVGLLQVTLVNSHFTAFPHDHPHKTNQYYNPHQYQPQPQYPEPSHPPAEPHMPVVAHATTYTTPAPAPAYPYHQQNYQPYNYQQPHPYQYQQPYNYQHPGVHMVHPDPVYQPHQPIHHPHQAHPVHPNPAPYVTEAPKVVVTTTAAPPPETTTAVAKTPKYLGTFKNPTHLVEGDIFMLDESTLYIQGFSFDGQAPDVYFWSDGVPIPYYTRADPNVTMNLKAFSKEDVVLMLPPEKPTLDKLGHFQIWCNMFHVVFGEFSMKDMHHG